MAHFKFWCRNCSIYDILVRRFSFALLHWKARPTSKILAVGMSWLAGSVGYILMSVEVPSLCTSTTDGRTNVDIGVALS